MKTSETTTLFKRVGRKYVPVSAQWYEDRDIDQMQANSFRLTYAYKDGGKKYEYDVTPATAPAAAAMLIAKQAMCDAIRELSRMRPNTTTQYTKKQLAIIEQFRKDMGGMYPSWWTENSDYIIANAAIKAVTEYQP